MLIIPVKSVNLMDEELAKNIGYYYYVLKELYPDNEYNVNELATRLQKEQSNTSTLVSRLDKRGLIETRKEEREGRPFKYIKLSSPVRRVINSILEASKPEEKGAWQPQPGEVKLCLEALEARETEESHSAFLSELGAILSSGYWDSKLDDFFIKTLSHPERYKGEIKELLQADPKNSEKREAFFKRERERIYDLVRRPSKLSSLAFKVFVDVSEGKEALDRMEEALKGEEAETVITAAHGYSRTLYDKFGLDFKRFLRKTLKHERKPVRSQARDIMNLISKSRR